MIDRPYIDKHGNRHSAAIFQHWHPAAIKALGIRKCTSAELREAATDGRPQ